MSVLKEKAQVIMLSTNKITGIILDTLSSNLIFNKNSTTKTLINQNLYIVSNEEIKEGDWVIDKEKVYLAESCGISIGRIGHNGNSLLYFSDKAKKIIATTDTSLREHDDTVPYPKTRIALPQPSQGFIEKYIEEYNKSNIITDILVEYEEYEKEKEVNDYQFTDVSSVNDLFKRKRLKVSKDNTITIHPVKDSWSKEELYNEVNTRFTCKNEIAFLKSFIKEL